jgi:alpha-tubulin suppressor-like RCC1 family protein
VPSCYRVAGLPPRARVVSVAAANKHSAAVTSAGEVWTWGGNASAQLGYGTSDSGCNPTPRLVEALRGRQLVKVAAAKHHTGRVLGGGHGGGRDRWQILKAGQGAL